MRLRNEVYEQIKNEVVFLFVRYGVSCIPISGFEIASRMGIIIVPYSGLSRAKRELAEKTSQDGFYLEPGDGKEYIFYNDTRGYERSNMTILHEIGHCVLGHSDSMDPDEAEAEANFFAKYAIAPPPLVYRIKPTSPIDILVHFYISYEAACNAYSYYHKWLAYSGNGYAAYEIALLLQFPVAA